MFSHIYVIVVEFNRINLRTQVTLISILHIFRITKQALNEFIVPIRMVEISKRNDGRDIWKIKMRSLFKRRPSNRLLREFKSAPDTRLYARFTQNYSTNQGDFMSAS